MSEPLDTTRAASATELDRRDLLKLATGGALSAAALSFLAAASPAVAQQAGTPVAWVYTDRTSYKPGETAKLHASVSGSTFSVELIRAGLEEVSVWKREGIPASLHETPADAPENGCNWPVAAEIPIGAWKSGYYRLLVTAEGASYESFIIVKPEVWGRDAKICFVVATNTIHAYNWWGGRNLYETVGAPGDVSLRRGVPRPAAKWVSIHRPYGPGLIKGHPDSPRFPNRRPRGFGERPFYQDAHYVITGGFSRWDFSAGFMHKWDHHFVRWCERNNIAIDYACQWDLDAEPDLLKPYKCYVSVGHDEYWSAGERDAVERFCEGGGNAIFFSGNTSIWQVRWEAEGTKMVGYKATAREEDPVVGTDRAHLMTGLWSDPWLKRPENQMTGVTFTRGGFANLGFATSRGIGGYLVYRPYHWALEGADLDYGDTLGVEDRIVGWEVDGCAFTFREGEPFPTGEDGTPLDFEIIAMAPATFEVARPERGIEWNMLLMGSKPDGLALLRYGEVTEESIGRVLRGHCVMGTFKKGAGQVFTCGCPEWSYGLRKPDPFVDRITRNLFSRFTA